MLDLAFDMLRMATKLKSMSVMFTNLTYLHLDGEFPLFMPVLKGLYIDEAVKPEMFTMEIICQDVCGGVKSVPAKNRINHPMDLLVYAVLVSAGKYSGQNGNGRDSYDLRKNNIHSIMWYDVEIGLRINGIPDNLIDKISRWLFVESSDLNHLILFNRLHEISAY